MKRLPLVFTVAGTLPFVALSVAVSMHSFTNNKAVVEILLTYAAVIVSFIGGVHWGIAVGQFGKHRRIANLLIAESVWPSITASACSLARSASRRHMWISPAWKCA